MSRKISAKIALKMNSVDREYVAMRPGNWFKNFQFYRKKVLKKNKKKTLRKIIRETLKKELEGYYTKE